MRRLTLAWCVLTGAIPLRLWAQHPTPAVPGELQAKSNCEYCHAAHVGRPTRYTLRDGGGTGEVASWQAARAPGTTAVTSSCLRCHLTEAARGRQGVPTGPQLSQAARYLGTAPAALHPLGAVQVRDLPPVLAVRRALDPVEKGSTYRGGRANQAVVLECSDCHDPHDRRSPIPDGSEQQLLCGSCHAAGEYASQTHVTLACSDCHSLHQARSETGLLRERTPDLQCQWCHAPASAQAAPAVGAERWPRLAAATVEIRHGAGSRCVSCHAAHTLGNP